MELYLQNVTESDTSNKKEIFTTNNDKIKEVSFEYLGTEDNLDRFFETTIHNYLRKTSC